METISVVKKVVQTLKQVAKLMPVSKTTITTINSSTTTINATTNSTTNITTTEPSFIIYFLLILITGVISVAFVILYLAVKKNNTHD